MALKRTPPPESLAQELVQVAEHATTLEQTLVMANALPDNFPVEHIQSICHALADLPHGTAEGCRIPLEYARSRLPALRRQFLPSISSPDAAASGAPDRGSRLDSDIVNLIGAVTTALDEYRYLATTSFRDSDSVDYSESIDDPARLDVALRNSVTTTNLLKESYDEAKEILEVHSVRSDSFIRSLRDADHLNSLARAESSMPAIVVRWLSMLAKTLEKLPAAIRRAGESLEIGADVANIGWARWDEFWSNLRDFGLNQVAETGRSFQAIADRLERRHKKRLSSSVAADDNEQIEFQDWLFSIVRSRDRKGLGVSMSLVAAEIYQRYGIHGSEFAKKSGFKNLKTLLSDIPGIRIVGSPGRESVVELSEEEHKRRRDIAAIHYRQLIMETYYKLHLEALKKGNDKGVPVAVLDKAITRRADPAYAFLWGTDHPKSLLAYLNDNFTVQLSARSQKPQTILSLSAINSLRRASTKLDRKVETWLGGDD